MDTFAVSHSQLGSTPNGIRPTSGFNRNFHFANATICAVLSFAWLLILCCRGWRSASCDFGENSLGLFTVKSSAKTGFVSSNFSRCFEDVGEEVVKVLINEGTHGLISTKLHQCSAITHKIQKNKRKTNKKCSKITENPSVEWCSMWTNVVWGSGSMIVFGFLGLICLLGCGGCTLYYAKVESTEGSRLWGKYFAIGMVTCQSLGLFIYTCCTFGFSSVDVCGFDSSTKWGPCYVMACLLTLANTIPICFVWMASVDINEKRLHRHGEEQLDEYDSHPPSVAMQRGIPWPHENVGVPQAPHSNASMEMSRVVVAQHGVGPAFAGREVAYGTGGHFNVHGGGSSGSFHNQMASQGGRGKSERERSDSAPDEV
eukprot:TRINITY_DN8716_c0_g1_i3.p1 TRINITY_DN8716_c0_g1~~TRINITY_DN8716_c0_g1_i3.p1  ORF type:complete len:371 (+),score=25.13 TRINITY_DN8716_c0_g1_i3:80-1192(+)